MVGVPCNQKGTARHGLGATTVRIAQAWSQWPVAPRAADIVRATAARLPRAPRALCAPHSPGARMATGVCMAGTGAHAATLWQCMRPVNSRVAQRLVC